MALNHILPNSAKMAVIMAGTDRAVTHVHHVRRPHAARSPDRPDLWVQPDYRVQWVPGDALVCPVPPGQQAQWDLRAM